MRPAGGRERGQRGVRWGSCLGLLLLCGGCLDTASARCPDGTVCPAGRVCAPAGGSCVLPAQLEACAPLGAGEPCAFAGTAGVCREGVCQGAGCGNGIEEPDEECDDGNTVAGDGCSADCQSRETCGNGKLDLFAGEACDCGDEGVEPPDEQGCERNNSDEPEATCRPGCVRPGCGDGVVVPPEECEAGVPLAATCDELGRYGGTLGCSDVCRYDLSACGGACGDGTLDPGELCDGPELAGASCELLGFYAEVGDGLACNAACTFDTSRCQGRCGDGELNGDEACDGGVPDPLTCLDLGFYFAPGLACTGACTFDTRACHGTCGDGDVNGPELCEGDPPYGMTCQSLGFEMGWLRCGEHCGPGFEYCRRIGWKPMPSPTQASLEAIWGSGPTDVFAVGAAGTILHYDGARWSPQASGVTVDLHDVWGAGPAAVWAVGDAGTILAYDGARWRPELSGVTVALEGVWASGPQDAWAVGAAGTLLRRDPVAGWGPVAAGTAADLGTVRGSAADDVWVAGDPATSGLLLHTDGTSWTQVPSGGAVFALLVKGPGEVYAAQSSSVRRFDGASWSTVLAARAFGLWSPPGPDLLAVGADGAWHLRGAVGWKIGGARLEAVWGSSVGDVFAVGPNGSILHLAGQAWAAAPALAGVAEPAALHAVAPGLAFVVGRTSFNYGAVARVTPSSSTGEGLPGSPSPLLDVWGSSETDVYAVGGKLYHRDASGWQDVTPWASYGGKAVWGSGPDDVFVVGGPAGRTFHWDGLAWTQHDAPTASELLAVWGRSPTEVYAAGEAGATVVWDGASWAAVPSTATADLRRLWSPRPGRLYALAGADLIVHDGADWETLIVGPPYGGNWRGLAGSSGSDGFAGLGPTGLFHHDGARWSPLTFEPGWVSWEPFDLSVRGDEVWFLGFAGTDPSLAVLDRAGFGACGGAAGIGCGESLQGTTIGGNAALVTYAGATRSLPGPERYHRLDVEAAGEATVTLAASEPGLDLVVLSAAPDGACDPDAVVAASTTDGVPETVTFTAAAGASYFLVVDGFEAVDGGYRLTVSCASSP